MKCDCLTLASAEVVNRHNFSAGASHKILDNFHESELLNPPQMGMPRLQEFICASDLSKIHNWGTSPDVALQRPRAARFTCKRVLARAIDKKSCRRAPIVKNKPHQASIPVIWLMNFIPEHIWILAALRLHGKKFLCGIE